MAAPNGAAGAAPAPKPMSLYQRFHAAAKALKHEVLALYYAVHDARTPLLARVLPWAVLMYALSPIDLIPDFIPILGLLDDLLLLPGLIWLALKMIPKQVMADARVRAEHEPLRLSRNWAMAVFIFLLWMAGLEYSAYLAVTTWGSPEVCEYTWHILGGIALLGLGLFIWWFVTALRKEARKRAKAEKKGKGGAAAGAAGRAGGPDVEQGRGGAEAAVGAGTVGQEDGLHEPLLQAGDEQNLGAGDQQNLQARDKQS